jgi:quinol monooxygenase YgiN
VIVIAGAFAVDGTQVATITAAVNAMRAATLQEDGCHEYRFSFATDDPDIVLIFEEWRDQESLTAHMSAPHMATFGAQMAGFVTGAPSLSRYEVTDKGPLR